MNMCNDILLPQHVEEELRRLGLPLAFYTQWQKQAAIRAAAIDCRVVEDDRPEIAGDLEDMLELTAEEQAARDPVPEARITGIITAGVGGVAELPGSVGGFVARLLEERVLRQAQLLLQPLAN